MPLMGADVVGNALRAQEAGEVERRHADAHAGGTEGPAGIDRHGATAEMVIPRHIAGVVHEEGTELGTGERDGAGLNSGTAGDVPGRVVVDDVVVVDDMASEGVGLVNTILSPIHDEVVVQGRVLVHRDGVCSGEVKAIFASL